MSVRKPLAERSLDVIRSVVIRYGLGLVLVLSGSMRPCRLVRYSFRRRWRFLKRAAELWLSGPPSRLFLGDEVFSDVLPSLMWLLGGWALRL